VFATSAVAQEAACNPKLKNQSDKESVICIKSPYYYLDLNPPNKLLHFDQL